MNAKVEIYMRITRFCDLGRSAKEIHATMWGDAAKALKDAGFECSLEELCIKQTEIMDAVRAER